MADGGPIANSTNNAIFGACYIQFVRAYIDKGGGLKLLQLSTIGHVMSLQGGCSGNGLSEANNGSARTPSAIWPPVVFDHPPWLVQNDVCESPLP